MTKTDLWESLVELPDRNSISFDSNFSQVMDSFGRPACGQYLEKWSAWLEESAAELRRLKAELEQSS